MNEIQLFNNEELNCKVRTVEIDGKPYFVGNDVAKALGYVDCPKAIRTHCKGIAEMSTPTKGGIQTLKVIPEGDVYRLIIKSKLPQAENLKLGLWMKYCQPFVKLVLIQLHKYLLLVKKNQWCWMYSTNAIM